MRIRSWIVATFVIAIVQAVLALLLVFQHDAVYSQLLRQRVSVIAYNTAETFRPILELGLPISMIRDGDGIVARGRDFDPNIMQVHAVNPAGIVVHSTGPKPATIVDEAIAAMRLADDEVWGVETGESIYSGFNILRDSGQQSGAVVVEYSSDALEAASRQIAGIAARTALLVLIVASGIAFVLISLALREPRRQLLTLRNSLDSPAGEAMAADRPPRTPLENEIARLRQTLAAATASFRLASDAMANPWAASGLRAESTPPSREALAPQEGGQLKSAILGRIVPITALLIVASAFVLGADVIRNVNRSIEPELAARTDLIGTVVSENVQHALDSGLELDDIVGADSYFGEMLARMPEVAYIAVATGRIVIEAGERIDPYLAPARERRDVRSHPIYHDGEEVAYVIIDIDPQLIAKRFRGVFLDVLVIVLVTILLAVELMLVLSDRTLSGGLEHIQKLSVMQAAGDFSRQVIVRGHGTIQLILRTLSERALSLHRSLAARRAAASEAQLAALDGVARRYRLSADGPRSLDLSSFIDIRLALFLFAAADELPLAFLPIYTRAAHNLWPAIDPSILISLPLAGYLLAIIVASPYARALVERFGVRALFIVAAMPTLGAHVGLYLASTAQEVILWRTATGFGYALVTLSAQDYVLSVTAPEQRDGALGHFTLVLFAGIFSGVALGGVLADRLGPANVFLVSAGLIAASAALSAWLIPKGVGRTVRVKAARPSRPMLFALADRQLSALVFGIAVPGAVMLQAFICYLVAVSLDAQGTSAGDIGRVLMLHFLTVMAVSPLIGRLTEELRLPGTLVVLAGALLTGVSLLPVVVEINLWTMALAMVGCGAGSALVRGTQVSLALRLAEEDARDLNSTAVLGALRTGERLGGVVGLVLIAAIAGFAGYATATLAIAIWALAGAGLYLTLQPMRSLTGQRRAG